MLQTLRSVACQAGAGFAQSPKALPKSQTNVAQVRQGGLLNLLGVLLREHSHHRMECNPPLRKQHVTTIR